MYPLNMHNAVVGGYAVANDEEEHKSLTAHGYGPAYVEPEAPADESEEVKRGPGRPRKTEQ